MPPADVAVKIVSALGVSVEYFFTGENAKDKDVSISKIHKYADLIALLDSLSDRQRKFVQNIISEISDW